MDVTNLLELVISTLNEIEVKGKDNLDRLLGCINALESVAQATAAAPAGISEKAEREVANG